MCFINYSTLSPEGGSDSDSSDSEDDLESPGCKAPDAPFQTGNSPHGSPVKQAAPSTPASDNKMDVDPTDGMYSQSNHLSQVFHQLLDFPEILLTFPIFSKF